MENALLRDDLACTEVEAEEMLVACRDVEEQNIRELVMGWIRLGEREGDV